MNSLLVLKIVPDNLQLIVIASLCLIIVLLAVRQVMLGRRNSSLQGEFAQCSLLREGDLTRLARTDYLLDQVKDALLIVDNHQEIQFANQAAKSLFDTTNFIGRPLIEVCLSHRFVEIVDEALCVDKPVLEEAKLTNDSRTFQIKSGKMEGGAWLMIHDISAEHHTEQVRQDFVSNASHELRTPLSIIKGYLEMMSGDSAESNAVKIMLKHTDRLARIVDDMLMISKLEGSDAHLLQNTTQFDIGDCINDTIEQLQPIIATQEAKISIDHPSDRELVGDRFYWDQILFNLVENALKQNPGPGLKITIKVKNKEGAFQIRVTDNGVGIPAADLPKIFKRFYRVDKSHAQTTKGTGLGLSIVKRAVEAHHGTIEVTSQPGSETSFLISVPSL